MTQNFLSMNNAAVSLTICLASYIIVAVDLCIDACINVCLDTTAFITQGEHPNPLMSYPARLRYRDQRIKPKKRGNDVAL